MKKVTIWKRLNKEGIYKHNHIEDDHVEGEKPKGQVHQTKSWGEGKWKRSWMWLNDENEVVK